MPRANESVLRIGCFTECYRPIINGIVASIDALREGLHLAGHETLCLAPDFPGKDSDETTIIRLPSLPLPTQTGYRLTLPLSTRELDARIGAPLDVVHAHSQFITGTFAARYARAHDVPLVFTYHTMLEEYAHYAPFPQPLTRRFLAARTRAVAARAAAVIAPSETAAHYLQELGIRMPIAVVPSAIDAERFRAAPRDEPLRRRLGGGDGSVLVLCVGRLAREKEPALVLGALAHLPDRFRLAFAGDGPLRGALEQAAADLGVAERVRFAGAIRPEAMPAVYACADVVAFASRTETQGLVLAEALAALRPIVAVDTPQARETAGTAAIYAPATPEGLAAAIERGAVESPDQSAIHLALNRCTIIEQARRIETVYRAALGGRA